MKLSDVLSLPQCRWTARHLNRYLDRDPSAPLTDKEQLRLSHHLGICDKCADKSEQFREISQALHKWRSEPDAKSIQRITNALVESNEKREHLS